MPQLLKPDFTKLDVRRLQADIPKFHKAGVPREKMGFWETIGEHLKRIEAKSEETPDQWILNSLLRRTMSHCENSSGPTTTLLPEELSSICAKETAPLPEVSKC